MAIFSLKIVWELSTGQMFFGTESLGNIGIPVPVSHAAGTLAALVCMFRERLRGILPGWERLMGGLRRPAISHP